MKLACQGHWSEICEQCKQCENIKAWSLHMDGNHDYCCARGYPLRDGNIPCPKFSKYENFPHKGNDDYDQGSGAKLY